MAEMRAAAHGMRWLDLKVELVLSSPLVRARQTAEIVSEVLKQQVTLAQGLASGCSLVELAQTLAEYVPVAQAPDAAENGAPPAGPAGGVVPRGVLLVGHEPDFSMLIGALIGRKGSASIVLKKGALCRVDLDPTVDGWRWDTTHLRTSGALAWLLTARQLGQLGR
jgi:phosphohistidine phosphatase